MSWVILDDTNLELQYQGTWSSPASNPDVNQLGNWGTVFQNTLHIASGSAKVSYTFNGTRAQIIGSTNHHNSEPIASLTCIVDGITHNVDDGRNTRTNNHCFCDVRDLSLTTPHTIEFSVDVPKGSSFLFDRLQYRPWQNATLSREVLAYDASHSDIRYDGVWKSSDDRTARYTQVTGSKASLTFIGTSVQWYGVYYSTFPRAQSTATWSIDGRVPQPFIVGEIMGKNADSSNPFRNQLLFQTGALEDTKHQLEVVFKGGATTVPLSLESLVVQDATFSKNSAPHDSNGSNNSDKSGGLSTGVKVGIGLGVTVGFIVLLLLPFVFRPWNRKRKQAQYRRERPIIPSSSRPRKSVSHQNLIEPTNECLPFISRTSLIDFPPIVNYNPPVGGVHLDIGRGLGFSDPAPNSTVTPSNLNPYQNEATIDDEPFRDRKTSSSTIASISNPFRAPSTSASCSTESTSLMTNISTSASQSAAWSHNHMPSHGPNYNVDPTSASFNTSAIPSRIQGELRDVKRSTPTFVYLQNEDLVGSTTTIDTMPMGGGGFGMIPPVIDPPISARALNPFLSSDSRVYDDDDDDDDIIPRRPDL